MNNQRYNQIIDEAYKNYITQARIRFQKWCEENPFTLIDFREDTKELFLKSIKEDVHWFTGEKNYSQKWGLKIEERELTLEERYNKWFNNNYETGMERYFDPNDLPDFNDPYYEPTPTKVVTVTYKDEKIEVYE